MNPSAWVLLALLIVHFGGLLLLIWRDPGGYYAAELAKRRRKGDLRNTPTL